MNEASIISDVDNPFTLIGLYLVVSMCIDNLLQSIVGENVLRKLIPRMMSPVASASMTIADSVNLTPHNNNVIVTSSLVVEID